MAKLAVTISVYAEIPSDDYQSTLEAIKQTIVTTFDYCGLQPPIIEHRNGIPAKITDRLDALS